MFTPGSWSSAPKRAVLKSGAGAEPGPGVAFGLLDGLSVGGMGLHDLVVEVVVGALCA